MNDALPRDIADAPHGPHPQPESSIALDIALDHARNTGANWGTDAASALLSALRKAPETFKAKSQETGADLDRLTALIAEAHGQAIADEWHRAAMLALEAALPSPD